MRNIIIVVLILSALAFLVAYNPSQADAATKSIVVKKNSNNVPKLIDFDVLAEAWVLQESGGKANAVGDKGKSKGWLQIQRPYWIDAGVFGGVVKVDKHNKVIWVAKGWEYETIVRDKAKSIEIAAWYCQRYAPEAYGDGTQVDWHKLSHLHNGGLGGLKGHWQEWYVDDIRVILSRTK